MIVKFLRGLVTFVLVLMSIYAVCNLTWGLAWAFGGEPVQKVVMYFFGACLLFIIGRVTFNWFVTRRKIVQ